MPGKECDLTSAYSNDIMKSHALRSAFASLLLTGSCPSLLIAADSPATSNPLIGTWTLVAADLLHPDGSRSGDYGDAPKGLLIIDAQGRYSLQIYKTERPKFASGDKLKGTPAEYEAAILGASTHFGTISVDPVGHVFTLNVESSNYPNQESTSQKRNYELKEGVLSYRVAPRPDGNTPISVWRKL